MGKDEGNAAFLVPSSLKRFFKSLYEMRGEMEGREGKEGRKEGRREGWMEGFKQRSFYTSLFCCVCSSLFPLVFLA